MTYQIALFWNIKTNNILIQPIGHPNPCKKPTFHTCPHAAPLVYYSSCYEVPSLGCYHCSIFSKKIHLMVCLLAVTLCIAYEFLLLVIFFCILEDLEFLFHRKKQGKYPKIQPHSDSMFFNDFSKNNIKKKQLCA